jgi:glyoxylase-like metal-dependent hydrolase (beta-lactamase superfamily II)
MIRAALASIAALSLGISQASAQDVSASYRRARSLVDSAIAAHGGKPAMARSTRVTARFEGFDYWRNQSPTVDPPYAARPWTGLLLLDLAKSRYAWTVTSAFPGGFRNASRTVIDGARSFNVNLRQNTLLPVPNRTVAAQRVVLNRLPHLLLPDVADNPATLRFLGNLRLTDGTRVTAVAWGSAQSPPLTLGFDPRSKLLTAILGVQPDALTGDATTEAIFSEYRSVGGIMVPGRRVGRIAGEVTSDVRTVAIDLDRDVPDSAVAEPPGVTRLPLDPPPNDDPVRPLAPGVWVIRGAGYWSLAVGYDDHWLVVDAPGGGTGEILARLRELAPGRPVRYVVPTHHHDDHAGGMRDYMAIGAAIVTPPANRSYFERMGRAVPTIRRDSLSLAPRPPRFEPLGEKSRTFSGNGPTVEIHNIGPSPHAKDMLIAWLPNEGILFQGDLLNLPPNGAIFPNVANTTTAHFAEWLKARGWAVKVLAGSHMPPGPVTQLDRALAVSEIER